jgi:formate hydrogenlyase subunit 3/multisubunit Na+/H+ antiporter MnhD subunit
MHIGLLFIIVGFFLLWQKTGNMSFDSLRTYFTHYNNIGLFLLFFIGFGIKAGFIPFHTWLPDAHPAAPSHVSGIMSGVMIKMGIFGIIRIIMSLQSELLIIGIIVLLFSIISGVLGVINAIVQHDIKKLLAYHSIENIGIIGIGLGIGIIGKGIDNEVLSILGFSGAILHVVNHSLFKSLLFYCSGSIYLQCHTRKMDLMGGLIKKMPYTAFFFLIGSLAISGLPPFNGFISEFLIYYGLFTSLHASNFYIVIILLLSIISLTLIGGLALFCFSKAFSIIFLGQARSKVVENAVECESSMLLSKVLITLFIIAIGFLPLIFVKPIMNVVANTFLFNNSIINHVDVFSSLNNISIITLIFVGITILILLIKNYSNKNKIIISGPTWGCGYTASNAKGQYTASSFADNFKNLAKPILGTNEYFEPIAKDEIFPQERSFKTENKDIVENKLIIKPVFFIKELLRKISILQTGQLQHYILYAFLFMMIILILSVFNLI